MDKEKLIQEAYLVAHKIEENGNFPNNPNLPLMIYKGTFRLHPDDNKERKGISRRGKRPRMALY